MYFIVASVDSNTAVNTDFLCKHRFPVKRIKSLSDLVLPYTEGINTQFVLQPEALKGKKRNVIGTSLYQWNMFWSLTHKFCLNALSPMLQIERNLNLD